jgi:hypothetical protein
MPSIVHAGVHGDARSSGAGMRRAALEFPDG